MNIEIRNYFAAPGIASKREVQIEEICLSLCEHFKITKNDLMKLGRHQPYIYYRQLYYYLLRELTKMDFGAIAEKTKIHDRCTIIHSHKKIIALMDAYPKVRDEVNLLKQKLG